MLAYLKDGTLDILGLQYYLTNGFEFPEAVFHPEAYIISIEEPDFGCEGRTEEKAYAVIQVYSKKGFGSFKIEDNTVYANQLFEDVWVGTRINRDGTKHFGCFNKGNNTWCELEEGIWNGKIGKWKGTLIG